MIVAFVISFPLCWPLGVMDNNLFAVHVRNSSKKLEVSNKLLEIFNMKTLIGFAPMSLMFYQYARLAVL